MYFSRLRLRADIDTSQLAQELCKQNTYAEHQQLWRFFADQPDIKRDFLFRRDDSNGWPQFYLLSQRAPHDPSGLWRIEQRDFQPQLQAGQQLGFSLRANPVVTRKNIDTGKSHRHDLIMDLKKKTNWKEQPTSQKTPQTQLWQQAGEQWLAPRLEKAGAQLNSVIAERYEQHKEHKKSQKEAIRYSSLDLQGTLTVTDPTAFLPLLINGIGPAKSLGCGLLLVRRI